MKVALTVWGNRISPVFDSAQTLLIVLIKNGKIIQKTYETVNSDRSRLLSSLKKLDVSVLICGAISEMPAAIITSSGIELIPFVTGNTAQVLDLYLSNRPVPPAYFMPGCRRHGCTNGLKNAAINQKREVRPMPGKDRTGPQGRGKGSGKGQGPCRSGQGSGKGQGRGQKRGSGQGRQSGQGSGSGQGRTSR